MSALPTGTVTFLFTDIAGSTRLWERQPEQMRRALGRHHAILRDAIQDSGGDVFKTIGDSFCAAFPSADQALTAAYLAQRAFYGEPWGELGALRVRMALHTGPAEKQDGDFLGPTVNRVARLLAAGHGGQVLLSFATQQALGEALPAGLALRDLGARRLRDLIEPERIFQLVVPDLPADFPALRTLDPRPTNLPAQLTSFVGRDWEVAAVCALLRRPEVRLLTLTGPGGTGKTRLALQAAANLLDEFEHGVYFVALAAARRPESVAPAITQALGLRETGRQTPGEALKEHARRRQLLFVLDNFEQILDAAPFVGHLLAAAPQVKVLVTSREALRIYGEHRYAVPPLALPDLRQLPSADQLHHYAAVALFLERARAAAHDFIVREPDVSALASLCVHLDGLPLALELAAARCDQFTLPELAAQMANRLELLAGGPRDLPARQRTLRATIDWSYALLTPAEQARFEQGGVFVGGFTPEAAVAVIEWAEPGAKARSATAGAAAADEAPDLIQAQLASLRDKSLLRQEEDAEQGPRYGMLETLRDYALERLAARGALERCRTRHAAYYLGLAERADSELAGPSQAAWLIRLEREHENLRAALGWALQQGEIETALRLAGSLWRFWGLHSYFGEGRRWLEQALARAHALPGALRAKALHGASRLALYQGEYAAARRLAEDSLALYRELVDREAVAWALNNLGEIALTQGDFRGAQPLFEESLVLYMEMGDQRGVAKSLDDLGEIVWELGDAQGAQRLFAEGLALRREMGSVEGIALSLMRLGEVCYAQGDDAQAQSLILESQARFRELGHTAGVVDTLLDQGYLASRQGRPWQAVALFQQALTMLKTELALEEQDLLTECLAGLAGTLSGIGQPVLAAHLFGTVHARLTLHGGHLPLPDRTEYARSLAATRARLGREGWADAWTAGQTMSLDEISAELARAELAI